MSTRLEGWESKPFTHEGTEHLVFRRGSGPGVVVMHEIPGITPPVERFARRVADAGFTVAMPWMFGEVGRPASPGYVLRELGRACVSREFRVLAANESSPITVWLRALARALHEEVGGRGVGALGMCLTGNFALAMSVDPAMRAPVLSQPSLPFPLGARRVRAVHASDADLAVVKDRCAKDELRILGLRFSHDPSCQKARFDTLRSLVGPAFEGIEIDSGPGNPHGNSRAAHSVLTEHFVDREGHPTKAALDRVIAFFGEQLR
jgi:dienelactone hydrolase